MKSTLILLVAFALLSGCASNGSVDPDTRYLAVTYATLKVIDGDAEKAQRAIEIVELGREFVESGAEVSIDELDSGVRDAIRWDTLDPADKLLAQAILQNAKDRLKKEIGDGVLNEDQKLKVLTVLDWIESAAAAEL